jgi:hydrogenase expression/formation protein HypC
MCLALPVRVVELKDGDRAIIDLAGVRKEISLELVDGVAVGDFVILHVGYALTRLDPDEAERTLALLRTAGVDAAAPADAAGAAGVGRRAAGMDAGGGVHGDGDTGRGKEWR